MNATLTDKMENRMKSASLLFLIFFSQLAFAGSIPQCLSKSGQKLGIDDAQAIHLEKTTANQFKTEAHVQGLISDVYPDHNGHKHFAIQFPGTDAGIEVVYNELFGVLPVLRVGMTVEACGEFITSTGATAQYPASPKGAIIHWVHINPNQGVDRHASGYLVINGQLCGQDASHAGHAHHNSIL